jgi:hypothetical protein
VSWERERYRLQVLEPARQSGNVPPPDWYVRYGLRGGHSDQGAFASQVAEVLAYWRELDRRGGRYQQLARALLTAHAELERDGPLTLQKFASHHEKARQEQAQRLARMAEAEARSATHAGPATIARLREALAVTETEVAAALSQAGVRVVSAFPRLRAQQHPKQAALAQNARQLGLRLSTEVLFGDAVRGGFRVLDGFRLASGRGLDEAALRAARDRTAVLPHADPARAPTEAILAILGVAARRPSDLDELLLSEVVERLRPLASRGFPQLAIAQEARDLGLNEDEAGLVAGALLAGETPRRQEALRRQAAEALDAGRLRAAQRLAQQLPAADSLGERIAARDVRVAALTREADEELALGRRELAAARLADALEMASDDTGLAGRLIALPPPAPRNATATPNRQQHVVVTWESSPLLAGRLRFLVTRGQGSGPSAPTAGTPVGGQTAQNRAIDEGAPTGADLYYSVFACYSVLADRIADACSPPAVTGPVMLLADVTQVQLVEEATSVTASWQPPHGAHAVLVRRGAGVPPRGTGDGTAVEASLTGFSDTGLRAGTEYLYRITVSYLASDGHRHCSAGVVVPARPAPEPAPVTDLTVTATGNGVSSVMANWTPPPHGEVRLVASDAPPQWQPGQRITAQGMAGLLPLHGVPRRHDDGRDSLELSLPSGRHYLVPLTVAGNRMVAGNVAVAELAGQVRSLAADRMHDCVRLAWEWPRGATDAVVRWAGGEHRCSKRAYDDEGGVTVTVGPTEALIEVRALYPRSDGPLTAPAASVLVPARGIAVRYRVYRGGMFRRQRRTVEFFPEKETRLPAVLVVQSAGRHPPDDPAEGETIARIEPQAVTPGRRLRVTVDVRKGPGWLACFIEPATTEVLLFPPPAEEMRLR